ncbi:MAG: hypothetical protein AAFO06_00880 [Cyanobacteria bacterium J06597_16]
MTTPDRPVNIFIGVMSVFLGHILITLLMFLLVWIESFITPNSSDLASFLLLAFFGIGITQLLYVVPLALWLRNRGRFDTMKGVVIGAALTVLLNGSCFVIMTGALG